MSSKPLASANRCPLCHLDINPGVNGWKEHLVDEGCENNPRKWEIYDNFIKVYFLRVYK